MKQAFLTAEDEKIRKSNVPERLFGAIAGRVEVDDAAADAERELEAAWILQQLNLDDTYSTIKPAIVHALNAMVVDHLEPPYINQYQSEYLSTLNMDHLWQIMDLDKDWCLLVVDSNLRQTKMAQGEVKVR